MTKKGGGSINLTKMVIPCFMPRYLYLQIKNLPFKGSRELFNYCCDDCFGLQTFC